MTIISDQNEIKLEIKKENINIYMEIKKLAFEHDPVKGL